MQELQIFNSEEFGPIRTVMEKMWQLPWGIVI